MARRKSGPSTGGERRRPAGRKQAWVAAALFCMAVLPYAGVLRAGFVWDDDHLIVQRPDYRDPELFWERVTRPLVFSPDYYRPVALMTLYADARIHGLAPPGFHFTNLILHGLATLLGYLVLRRLHAGAAPILAVVGALLFAWHPVNVETVSFVSSRFDLVCAVFYLLALRLALDAWAAPDGRRRHLAAAGTGVAFLLALGAKEMAVTFPVVAAACLAWVSLRRGDGRGRDGRPWIPLAVSVGLALAAYLVLRVQGLGHLHAGGEAPGSGALPHLLLVGRTLVSMLGLLLVPWGRLSPIHPLELPLRANDAAAGLALVVAGLLVAALVWTMRRGRSEALLWGAFLAALAPVINIVPVALGGKSYLAERFLYLPSFLLASALLPFAAALLAAATRRGRAARHALAASAVALLLSYVVTVGLTVPRWHDETSLWTWAGRQAPRSDFPWINLGVAAHREGRGAAAVAYAQRALEANPSNANAYDLAGAGYLLEGDLVRAETTFRRGVAMAPGYANLWANLASAVRQQGRIDEARDILLQKALPRAPDLWTVHLELGRVELAAGRAERAIEAFDRAWRLVPGSTQVASGLAEAHRLAGHADEAERWSRLAEAPR